jgi:hypothetical protein
VSADLETLARRAVACKHWRWMPGMKVVWPNGNEFRVGQVTGIDGQNHLPNYPSNGWGDEFPDRTKGLPDLTDPATRGCLLALVREVLGKPIWVRTGAYGNEVCWCDGPSSISVLFFDRDADADSEASALVAVLEAAP